ncbi:hypothetical protein C8N24_0327 [Solirubrobacter pauli]|uniref:Uncharacterized protein n=1 Tax=Solirubrobacter pauli TaxID=166793 RepID=A0A660L647_9ACTN|nr:hypothetical protein [Solirubrobacter pauli]RKQ90522.1 hypothetical protein C8N24_0327 [Solirubrobacter pauli]
MFLRLVEFEIAADTPAEAEAAWEDDGPECADRVTAAHVFEDFGPTVNGYDPLWLIAINRVLEERGSDVRVADLDESLWTRFLGPLIDTLEDGYAVEREVPNEAGA